MKAILVKETEVTSGILRVVLCSFRAEQINTIPFSGSWTAGQVAEHLILSASGVLENLHGRVRSTERDPFEKAYASVKYHCGKIRGLSK